MRLIWALLTVGVACHCSAVEGQDRLGGDRPAEEREPTVQRPFREPEPEEETESLRLTPTQLRELAAALKINQALDADFSIEVSDQPLNDILRDISKSRKIPIVVDPEGLEVASVPPDAVVAELKLQGVSLRNALRALLKPWRLAFVVRHEMLLITSLDCPERMATVRTFALGDMVKRLNDPSELITTLEAIWPDEDLAVGDEKSCEPRARILAGHLIVRGSPRHIDLAEQLIDGLTIEPARAPPGRAQPAAQKEAPADDKPLYLPLPKPNKKPPPRLQPPDDDLHR